jgi:hypothetical protein
LLPIPYVVKPSDTLKSLSESWQVPEQLIVNINRSKLPSNGQFLAGLELKAVPGPFRAEIDSPRGELTLFLGDMYAGRFPIDVSACGPLAARSYLVESVSIDERTGEAMFLDLGDNLTISAANSRLPNSLVLSDADARDVFGILSKNCQVNVLR